MPRGGRQLEQDLARLIGLRIRELRAERGWNQIDLEAHLDGAVKRATISYFESGKRLPSVGVLARIANAFDVEPAAMLLNPQLEPRHRVALAVLRCPDVTVEHVAKLVD